MLTKRIQIQAITNLLAGKEASKLDLSGFSEKNGAIYQTLLLTPPNERPRVLDALATIDPGIDVLVGRVVNEAPADTVALDFSAEEVDILCPLDPPVEYLWDGWIPRGEMSMLISDPGVGKTHLIIDLIRRHLNGMDAPDGQKFERQRPNILYVDAEDYRKGIYSRIKAYRATEPSMWPKQGGGLYIMPYPRKDLLDFADPRYQDALTERIISIQPDWVIIDSISSAIIRHTFDTDVAPIMAYFSGLVNDFNLALTFLHHNNKMSNLRDFTDTRNIAGAGLLARRSRVVIGMGYISKRNRVDKKNDPRKVQIIKTNDWIPDPLAFRFTPLHPRGVFLDFFDLQEAVQGELRDNQQAAIEAITALGDKATANNLADHLGVSRGYLSTVLTGLLKEGFVEKAGRGSPYKITEKPHRRITVKTFF